ncbi:hypothetical protein VE02_03053 [Pseudogymnoascus sp. 03VT05]|nr:hypothetical protein VE02_03053 [Pseudogymnoascus sp. 03VT05]
MRDRQIPASDMIKRSRANRVGGEWQLLDVIQTLGNNDLPDVRRKRKLTTTNSFDLLAHMWSAYTSAATPPHGMLLLTIFIGSMTKHASGKHPTTHRDSPRRFSPQK